MSVLLFKKAVDQSLLKDGTAIPKEACQALLDNLSAPLQKGIPHSITVTVGNVSYEATIYRLNLSQSSRDVIQLRYSGGRPICQKIREVFSHSQRLLSQLKVHPSDVNTQLSVPAADREYIEFYAVGRDQFEMKCYPIATKKDDFLKYIGGAEDLSGYQRSYKLVFLKAFLDYYNTEGEALVAQIAEEFRQFYLNRKQKGLLPDKQVDPVIENIETSSLQGIYGLIIKNPFNAFHRHNYFSEATIDGKKYFKINPELWSELSPEDIQYLKDLVGKKLQYYYSKIQDVPEKEPMREMVCKVLEDYISAKSEQFAAHPLGTYFRNDIPNIIYQTGIVNSKEYLITGSVGQGQWATVPWICIFDRNITTTATKGVYIVYLLSRDGKSLYLTFNQGCTNIRHSHTKRDTIKLMHENAASIRSRIGARGFIANDVVNLGDNLPELAELYQEGTIFYKEYKKGNVPSESEIREDLSRMMEIYKEYAGKIPAEVSDEEEQTHTTDGGESQMPLTNKETLNLIKEYIDASGFSYEDGLIENFYLSLKSKPFVILAGTSGTGKTKLVKLFAEAIGAEYKLVPVRPDWSDSSDLFGHVDLNGKFVAGPVIDFLLSAREHPHKPHLLCLDEMNLARVEYYLSDFLSIIETRKKAEEDIVSAPLMDVDKYGTDPDAREKYGRLEYPSNLYVIGTVNMDETTFPFSKKVLDRANTIEFSHVNLIPDFGVIGDTPIRLTVDNSFLRTDYLILKDCSDHADYIMDVCSELEKINQILQKANAHVGYRVRDEIIFYMLNNSREEVKILSENDALDNEIMQKILPRIQGSSSDVYDMLCELFMICAGDYTQKNGNCASEKMRKLLEDETNQCKYRKSAEKLKLMAQRFEQDGFTSYWL